MGDKSDVFCRVLIWHVRLCSVMLCSVMLCYVMLCSVMLCSLMCLSCSVLSCSVLFSSVIIVEGAGGGITRDTRDNLGSGGRGMQGGGGREVCP